MGVGMDVKWQRARELRSGMTDAERAPWRHLRARQLQGWKFRRQYPIAGFIADFACVEASLVIELDGGQHVEQVDYDRMRADRLNDAGYRVLRFWKSRSTGKHGRRYRLDHRGDASTPPQASPSGKGRE